jgi:hypothetical protein
MADDDKVDTKGDGEGDKKPADGAGDNKGHWSDAYPEDLRGDLKGYDKPETLAKEHVELKKKYQVPEKPEDYEFEDKELDEIQKKNLTAFKAKAREMGLTKDQFKNLTAYEMELSRDLKKRIAEAQKKAEDTEKEKVRKGVEELKGEWGNKFESNLNLAKKTMNNIFPASFSNFLEESGLGNHPEMVRAMVRLSESVSEDVLVRNDAKRKPANRDPDTGMPRLIYKSMNK